MQTRTKLIIACFLFAMVAHMAGCGRDGDAVVVDFSKTVAVERPKSPTPESAQLKVAVAAIISPKETFIYYRQLLDYIGNKMPLLRFITAIFIALI
jgi:phosphonate transport system substrate-binding protein